MRRDSREPLGLGSAITMMMTERGMAAPAAGGNVLAQFDAIITAAAPELAGHVQAVAFDPATGRLDVTPEAPAYGTKLRWTAPKLIAAANAKAPNANVRTLHILSPAPRKAGPANTPAPDRPAPTATTAPVQGHTPSDGYRRAVEAHRAAAPAPRADTAVDRAVERQTAAMRALSRRAFPEPPEEPAPTAHA
ncbi:DciA family protein [Streptomyces mirabilis]